MLFRYFHNNNMYTFYLDNINSSFIRVVNNDTGKTTFIRVFPSDEYTIKGNKKSISAAGGARGLFSFLADCVKADFMTAYVNRIIQDYC